jgi:hypothetical protein
MGLMRLLRTPGRAPHLLAISKKQAYNEKSANIYKISQKYARTPRECER